jgi:hypothetical protein
VEEKSQENDECLHFILFYFLLLNLEFVKCRGFPFAYCSLPKAVVKKEALTFANCKLHICRFQLN